MAAQTQFTVRFPEDVLERIDGVATALSRFGTKASRADALRFIVSKGLEPAETELGIAPAKAPTKPAAGPPHVWNEPGKKPRAKR